MRALICEHHRYQSSLRVGSHHVATVLRRKGWKVVWFSHPKSWGHVLVGGLPAAWREHDDGVVEIVARAPVPYWGNWPTGSFAWGRSWLKVFPSNRRLLHRALCAADPERSAGEAEWDLLWVSDFTTLPILEFTSARRVVMRHFDLLEHFDGTPVSIQRLVAHYQARADLHLASSPQILEALKDRAIKAQWLPNGVDLLRFPKDLALREDRGDEVVYVGAIREWFDFAAVEAMARRMPDIAFRIVGPDSQGKARRFAAHFDNVMAEGAMGHDRIPHLLSRARFGLIPFRRTPLTEGVDPLKLYEYLACGLPTLSAALPAVRPGAGILIYDNPEQGAELLRSAWGQRYDRRALRAVAESRDWTRNLELVLAQLGLSE